MGIIITETAAREVKNIISQQVDKAKADAGEGNTPIENLFLRLGVKGGGCSGFNYTLDLTDQRTEDDEEFVCNGVDVVCDPKSFLYLNGVTVDFRDEIMGRGFVFTNPNATSSCGCGSSFAV